MLSRLWIGPLSVVATLTMAMPASAAPISGNLLDNPSFETLENICCTFNGAGNLLPTSFADDWRGELASIVTAGSITPADGTRMLQFVATGAGPAHTFNSSEVFQIVDVSGFAAQIAGGDVVAQGNFFANRVAGDDQTDTRFLVHVLAMTGAESAFPFNIADGTGVFRLAEAAVNFDTDADVSTWQEVSVTLPIPVGTTYLGIRVGAVENVVNDTSAPEFDGHFADKAFLGLVSTADIPEPTTLALFAFGLIGMGTMRRRLHN